MIDFDELLACVSEFLIYTASFSERISKLEKDRSQLVKDGNDDKNILERISDTLNDLYRLHPYTYIERKINSVN